MLVCASEDADWLANGVEAGLGIGHRRFHFATFAIDDERVDGEVIPGVGGMVYPRLGLGNMEEKNHYIPEMVLSKL